MTQEAEKAKEQATQSPKFDKTTLTNEVFNMRYSNDPKVEPLVVDVRFNRIMADSDLFKRFTDVLADQSPEKSLNCLLTHEYAGKNRVQYPLTAINYISDSVTAPVMNKMLPLCKAATSKGFDKAYLKSEILKEPGDALVHFHVFDITLRIPALEAIKDERRAFMTELALIKERIEGDANKEKLAAIKKAVDKRNDIEGQIGRRELLDLGGNVDNSDSARANPPAMDVLTNEMKIAEAELKVLRSEYRERTRADLRRRSELRKEVKDLPLKRAKIESEVIELVTANKDFQRVFGTSLRDSIYDAMMGAVDAVYGISKSYNTKKKQLENK